MEKNRVGAVEGKMQKSKCRIMQEKHRGRRPYRNLHLAICIFTECYHAQDHFIHSPVGLVSPVGHCRPLPVPPGRDQGEARIPIAVYDIYDEKGPRRSRPVRDILQADLRHSGIFDVMEPKKLDIGYSSTAEPSVELVKRAGTLGLPAWPGNNAPKEGDHLPASLMMRRRLAALSREYWQ